MRLTAGWAETAFSWFVMLVGGRSEQDWLLLAGERGGSPALRPSPAVGLMAGVSAVSSRLYSSGGACCGSLQTSLLVILNSQ